MGCHPAPSHKSTLYTIRYTHVCCALCLVIFSAGNLGMIDCYQTTTWWRHDMETSSASLVVRVEDGESTGYRWITFTKGQWHEALVYSLMLAWTNCWTNNHITGELGRRYAHLASLWWIKHHKASKPFSSDELYVQICKSWDWHSCFNPSGAETGISEKNKNYNAMIADALAKLGVKTSTDLLLHMQDTWNIVSCGQRFQQPSTWNSSVSYGKCKYIYASTINFSPARVKCILTTIESVKTASI